MSYECSKCYHEKPCKTWGNEFLMEDDKYCDCFVDKDSVAPAAHGKWIYSEDGLVYWVNCSICNHLIFDKVESSGGNYCPNCGAKMDLEEVNENGKILQ